MPPPICPAPRTPMVLIESRCAMLHPSMRSGGAHSTGALLLALALAFASGCAGPSATERAQSLARQGKDDQAAALLEKRVAEHPDDVPARRLLVRILGYTGNLPRARAQAEELARILGP